MIKKPTKVWMYVISNIKTAVGTLSVQSVSIMNYNQLLNQKEERWSKYDAFTLKQNVICYITKIKTPLKIHRPFILYIT